MYIRYRVRRSDTRSECALASMQEGEHREREREAWHFEISRIATASVDRRYVLSLSLRTGERDRICVYRLLTGQRKIYMYIYGEIRCIVLEIVLCCYSDCLELQIRRFILLCLQQKITAAVIYIVRFYVHIYVLIRGWPVVANILETRKRKDSPQPSGILILSSCIGKHIPASQLPSCHILCWMYALPYISFRDIFYILRNYKRKKQKFKNTTIFFGSS